MIIIRLFFILAVLNCSFSYGQNDTIELSNEIVIESDFCKYLNDSQLLKGHHIYVVIPSFHDTTCLHQFLEHYQSRITRINERLDYSVSLHGQEANCDSVYTEHYSLCKKVRKLYYIDSTCRRHPKVSNYRRNGSLKYDYYYYHGKYLYSVKYSRKEEVKRLRGKKIDKTVSKFMADSVDTKCHNKLDQNDIKQGYWCDSGFVPDIYNIDGIVSLRVGEYKDGLENGLWKYYHKYGKQLYMTREYKLGKLNGAVTYYNIKGNIVAQYTFINEVKEGVYKSYYDSGQIMVVANFSSNKLSGEYIRYSKNGEVEFEIEDVSFENPYER